MSDKKSYSCSFKYQGGRSGEYDYDLEASFPLTESEYEAAVKALDEYDNRLNGDLPDEMYDAIWEAALDQEYEDIAEFHLWELEDPEDLIPGCNDMTPEEIVEKFRNKRDLIHEIVDVSGIAEMIFNISYPEDADK